ncbi:hypothetical protein PRIPAC_97288 [Pristionchus pacificus]|uniref:Uncharacterized protein n=1 Tax=Pristionchus pacificus TaxID=54126 RepID=A0A2A6BJY6_PRIPA|nr:hypothetical protein PRIPAC_97288 [Pristionchus pacificus]|eukprot:PDM66101.1 hypothetical protein PRIPAC_45326 [Pristionchus pacificus]
MTTTNEQNVKGVYVRGIFCPVAAPLNLEEANKIYAMGLERGIDLGILNNITPLLLDAASKMNKEQVDRWLISMRADPLLSFVRWMASVFPHDLSLHTKDAHLYQRPITPQVSRKRAIQPAKDKEEIIDVVGDSEDPSRKVASSSTNFKRPKSFTMNDLLTQNMLAPSIPLRQTSVIVNTPLDLSAPRVSKKNDLEPAAPSSDSKSF